MQNDQAAVSCTKFNDPCHPEVENPLYVKLRQKMSSFKKKKIFSMKFKLFKTIGYRIPEKLDQAVEHVNDDLRFSYPSEVRIARYHKCLVIADDENHRILFLDLETYRLKTEFIVGEPGIIEICIVYNNGNEFIYFGDEHDTYKFNMADILTDSKVHLKDLTPIWKITADLSGSIVILQDEEKKENILLRWNNTSNGLEVRREFDATLRYTIPLKICNYPGLFPISNSEIIAVNHEQNIVFKITLLNGKCECSNGFQVSSEWHQPLSVATELDQGRIFISDYGNKRIIVWDLMSDREIMIFKDETLSPFGLFYDDETGLLYIVDQQEPVIRIYQ